MVDFKTCCSYYISELNNNKTDNMMKLIEKETPQG